MEQGFGLLLQDGLDFLFGVVVGGFQRAFRRARLCYQIQVWTIVKVPGLKDPSLLGRQSGNGSMQSGQDDFPFEITGEFKISDVQLFQHNIQWRHAAEVPLSNGVQCCVARDAQEPGTTLRIIAFEFIPLSPSLDENHLSHVLRIFGHTKHTPALGQHQTVMFTHPYGKMWWIVMV